MSFNSKYIQNCTKFPTVSLIFLPSIYFCISYMSVCMLNGHFIATLIKQNCSAAFLHNVGLFLVTLFFTQCLHILASNCCCADSKKQTSTSKVLHFLSKLLNAFVIVEISFHSHLCSKHLFGWCCEVKSPWKWLKLITIQVELTSFH